MLHKTKEATTTITDLGEFEAIAAAYTLDRQNEIIVRGAFSKTIAAWQAAGRNVPLHWNHSGKAEDIIGAVDPGSMRERADGLFVAGKLDLEESEVAREAWRLMKANTIALSFGYLVTKDRERTDGVRELREIDLYEVSFTPSPANPDTRILVMKSAQSDPLDIYDEERLRAEARRLGVDELARKAAPIKVARFEVE